MISYRNAVEHGALVRTVREAYIEIFPTRTVEERLRALEPGAYVAVTCSPSRGVDETLQMTARLADRGFRVIPHVAARMVRDRAHLAEIMAQLNDLPVDSIFVPGGDAGRVGDYATALAVLRDMAEFSHRFRHIGVAAHPEGHPRVDDETMLEELLRKQPYATYLVTQMCFDPELLGRWLRRIRDRGVHLPAWLGIPGVAERAALLKTSLRIGVGDSLRFLRRRSAAARRLMQDGAYRPDALISGLGPLLADPASRIDGCHIFCFNHVEATEAWRRTALARLTASAPPGPA